MAGTEAIDLGVGGARFLQGVGRLDACPTLLHAPRWLALAPCLGAEGGFLRGDGVPAGRSAR